MARGRVVVEVVGDGPHYVWNGTRTALVTKDGPIDSAEPFFVVPLPAEPGEPVAAWPVGWTELGFTRDDGRE